MKQFLYVFLLLFVCSGVRAQVPNQTARRLRSGTTDPNTATLACNPGPPYTDIFILTTDHSEWQCTAAPHTWTKVTSGSPASGTIGGSSGSVDRGLILANGTGGSTVQGSSTTISSAGVFGFVNNQRQIFSPGSQRAGLNVGSVGTDPSIQSNGDIWYNTTAFQLRAIINGSVVNIGGGGTIGGSGTLNTIPKFSPDGTTVGNSQVTDDGTTVASPNLTIGAGAAITSSGPGGALGTAAFKATGTSGATVPLLNGVNTFSAVQVVNLNAASAPTGATGTGIQLVGTDATVARYEADGIGAAAFFSARRAGGTGAALTATPTATQIGAFNWHGYDGAAWTGPQASISALTTQLYTASNQGSKVTISTTPNNSTTLTVAATFDQDQSATFANTVTATTFVGALTGHASLDLPLTGGTLSGGLTLNGAALTLSGAISGSGIFGTSGIRVKGVAATFTDTTSSGTVASAYNDVLGGNTWAASSATTITNAYAMFLSQPVQGSNVTLTNKWALGLSGGLSVASGQILSTQNGALSTGSGPGMTLTGTWITGGSATTTKPYILTEPSGTTSTGWSTNGTGLGVNAASGFTGDLLNLQTNGVVKFKVTATGGTDARNNAAQSFIAGDAGGATYLSINSTYPTNRISSGSSWGGTDVGIDRSGAGVLNITNGAANNALGSLAFVSATATGTFATSSTTDATTTTTGALQVAGGAAIRKRVFIDGISASAGLQTAVLCQSSGGEMIADSVACLASSGKTKDNIQPLNQSLNEIMRLRPISFTYKPEGIFAANKNFQKERPGLIAEEVNEVDPRLVGFEKDGVTPRTVGYELVVPVLIGALQELRGIVADQQKQIAALNARPLVRYHPKSSRAVRSHPHRPIESKMTIH